MKGTIFAQNYKFTNKNHLHLALKVFEIKISRPLFIFRPIRVILETDSILTMETMVEFLIYCVLTLRKLLWLSLSSCREGNNKIKVFKLLFSCHQFPIRKWYLALIFFPTSIHNWYYVNILFCFQRRTHF